MDESHSPYLQSHEIGTHARSGLGSFDGPPTCALARRALVSFVPQCFVVVRRRLAYAIAGRAYLPIHIAPVNPFTTLPAYRVSASFVDAPNRKGVLVTVRADTFRLGLTCRQPLYFDRRVLSRPSARCLRFADVHHVAYHLEDVFGVGLITVAIRHRNRAVAVLSNPDCAVCDVLLQLFVESFTQLVEEQALVNLAPNCFNFIHYSSILGYQNARSEGW